MFTKEKFLEDRIDLHIKSPETKKEYVKLIQKLIDLGWETYDRSSAENLFYDDWIYLPYICDILTIHPKPNPDGAKEIQVSDILGTQFEVGKWWLNLKPGDKIKCTEVEQKNYNGDIYGGAGWKSNEVFTVRYINHYKTHAIIFIKENNQHGIYTNSCIPYSEVKPTFEFNKWYKSNNADGLFFIQSKNTGYGFRSNHVNYWFTNNKDFEWNIDGLEPASSEEVSERLLNYAKEKYLKDYVYFCPLHKENCVVIKQNFDTTLTPTYQAISESDMGLVFLNGQWAEIISKPENKESKEMQLSDLKHPVFNIGDKVRVIADSLKEFNSSWSSGNNAKYKKGYEGLIAEIEKTKSGFKEVNTWYYLDGNTNAISCNLLELAEPAKEEFDKDWYVEVNSQEEADKVFDWLRAQGGPVINTNEWLKFRVNIDKCITYWEEKNTWFVNNNPGKNTYQKQLSDIIPNYSSEPKVNRNVYYEVSNQEQYNEILDWLESKGGETRDGFCDPCSEYNRKGCIEEKIIESEQSNRTIPEIETVTNRFKAQPTRKRVLPEIY